MKRWMLSMGILLTAVLSAQERLPSKKIPVDSLQPPAEWEIAAQQQLPSAELEKESVDFLPSLLQAGTDPLLRAATFDWGVMRYQWRGYFRETADYYVQGAKLNHPFTGRIPWFVVNGLSSRIRVSNSGMGLQPVDFSAGSLSGSALLEVASPSDRKQTSCLLGYSGSRGARRFNLDHRTGLLPGGWSAALFFQYAYVLPTPARPSDLQSFSGLFLIEKNGRLNRRTSLLFCYAPQDLSKQPAVTREVLALSGQDRYNSNWGWQQGQMRFAGRRYYRLPACIVTHEQRINAYSKWRLAGALITGMQSDQGLDWYNAPDPRPDYYRYLPSFFADADLQKRLTQTFRENPALLQIDWSQLYAINAGSVGTGMRSGDRFSRYVLEERMARLRVLSFHFNYHTLWRAHTDFSCGISWQRSSQRNRRKIIDLLGGDYYLNLNSFAASLSPQAAQYDIIHPDRVLRAGDFFGYDYAFHQQSTEAWFQLQRAAKKWDWFITGKWVREGMFRRGYVVNGLFPHHSGGDSPPLFFHAGMVKLGITRKFRGRHFFYLHTAYQTRAPLAEQLFIHPRYSNRSVEEKSSIAASHAELGWILRTPKWSSRLTLYQTLEQQGPLLQTFYSDQQNGWVNHVITGSALLHGGLEWSGSWQLHPDCELDWAFVHATSTYHHRPLGTLYNDLNENLLASERLYIKGFRSGNGPQRAAHLGINYRSAGGWMFNLSINHLSNRWVSIQPLRRTSTALLALPNPGQADQWLQQEPLPATFLLHLLAGYQWRVFHHAGKFFQMRCFISARNLPGRMLLTGGYEQLRWEVGANASNLFPNKYFFTSGRYISASLQIIL